MTPTPELYVAHPVLGGAVVTDTTVYVARCPHEGCHHAPDHGDPQVALDAVMGHWHREHAREWRKARNRRAWDQLGGIFATPNPDVVGACGESPVVYGGAPACCGGPQRLECERGRKPVR